MRGRAATFDQPTEFKICKRTALIAQVTLSYNWKYIGFQQHGKKEPVSTIPAPAPNPSVPLASKVSKSQPKAKSKAKKAKKGKR